MSAPDDSLALFPPISDPLDPAYVLPEILAGRPRVLLIGDSISIGYTLAVRAQLAGFATVFRPADNCGQVAHGLRHLAGWLGSEPWDVIHFNFGLHDLKYLDRAGNYVTPDQGRQVAPLPVYRRNLEEMVTRLAATGARLIFATTTPIPAGAAGRPENAERAYNRCALEIMKARGIPVNDLWSHAIEREAEIMCPNDVHFTPAGYIELAGLVARQISAALETRPSSAPSPSAQLR